MTEDIHDATRTLHMLAHDRERIQDRIRADDRLVYRVFAAAYLLGFGAQFVSTASGQSFAGASWVVVATAGSLALALVIWHNSRRYQGIRGAATRRPRFQAAAWLVALGSTATVLCLTHLWVPTADLRHVGVAVASLAAGLMYLGRGITVADTVERGLGAWLVGCGIVAAVLPTPGSILATALLGSSGFFVASVHASRRRQGLG